MKINTIIIFVDKDVAPQTIEFDTLEIVEITEGIELDGYAGCKYRIASINKEQAILKVLVAHSTPDTKIKEYRAQMIPKLITLATTNKFEYEGTTRTTDIPSKLRELMPSAPKEVIAECFEVFNEILVSMEAINVQLKRYKPVNANVQGYIKHHFPSPKFPETVKN